jgi:hypothetical protein
LWKDLAYTFRPVAIEQLHTTSKSEDNSYLDSVFLVRVVAWNHGQMALLKEVCEYSATYRLQVAYLGQPGGHRALTEVVHLDGNLARILKRDLLARSHARRRMYAAAVLSAVHVSCIERDQDGVRVHAGIDHEDAVPDLILGHECPAEAERQREAGGDESGFHCEEHDPIKHLVRRLVSSATATEEEDEGGGVPNICL